LEDSNQEPAKEFRKIKIRPRVLVPSPDNEEPDGEEPPKETTPPARSPRVPFEPHTAPPSAPGKNTPEKESQNLKAASDVARNPPGSSEIWDVQNTGGHAASEDPDQQTRKKKRRPKNRIKRIWRSRVRSVYVLLPGIFVTGLLVWGAFVLGEYYQNKQTEEALSEQGVEVSDNYQSRLDGALADLRGGNAEKAFKQLSLLEQENPQVCSLTYLVALSAMQAGNESVASARADASISKRERVSDSLALKAVLETRKARNPNVPKFGDPRIAAETYLRQAMLADAANPFPCIELATLLRYAKREEEAMKLLQAARSRLNPVDSHTVVGTSIALMKLQHLADNELPANINPDKDPVSMFSAAYIAMRKKDFARAASLLRTAKERLPADLNSYIVNDPAFRKFVQHPEVAAFFQ